MKWRQLLPHCQPSIITQRNTIISKEEALSPICFSSQRVLCIIEKTWTFSPTSVYQVEVRSPACIWHGNMYLNPAGVDGTCEFKRPPPRKKEEKMEKGVLLFLTDMTVWGEGWVEAIITDDLHLLGLKAPPLSLCPTDYKQKKTNNTGVPWRSQRQWDPNRKSAVSSEVNFKELKN